MKNLFKQIKINQNAFKQIKNIWNEIKWKEWKRMKIDLINLNSN